MIHIPWNRLLVFRLSARIGNHSMRTPQVVAARALAMAAIAARGSFEVTHDPRVSTFSERLLPWLQELGVDAALDLHERELLTTPWGQLRQEQHRDAFWSIEGFTVLSGALELSILPPHTAAVDIDDLYRVVPLLRPDAALLVEQARLRPEVELRRYACEVTSLRHLMHTARLQDELSRQLLWRIHDQRLSSHGLAEWAEVSREVEPLLAAWPDEERGKLPGRIFCREHAALWLFDERATYFHSDATT